MTVNQGFDIVGALAVKEGRITAVGRSELIRRLASPETRVVDLGGKTVLPGFNDNHIHMGTGAGGSGSGENWRGKIDSLDSLSKALREKAEEFPTSEWIRAGLTRPYFPNDIAPDRHWLDQRVPYHPVALTRLGYSSFNVPGLRPWDLRFFQEAYERWGEKFPRVTIQLRLSPGFDEHDDLEEGVQEAIAELEGLGFHTGFGNDRIKIGAIKMSVDGGLSAPTFWTKVPYDNTTGWRKGMPDFYGLVRISEDSLYRVSKRAHELGWQLGIHTIGDAAVEMAVNVIERVLKESPRENSRPYLHHVSVMPPEETLRKMAELDIIVASQPAFMYWLGPFAVEVLEGEREQTNNPQKTFLKRGIRMSYGTDGAPTDPRLELWSAVMRKGWDGKIYGPGEKVSLEEAIRAITMGTAYMNFDEEKKGSLEVGKFADMVVLGQDILTIEPDGIKDISIEMTIIGGKIVFSREQTQHAVPSHGLRDQ